MNDLSKITLRTAPTKQEADQLVELLAKNGIKAVITKDSGDLDASIQGESLSNKFEINIHKEKQSEAEAILIAEAQKDLDKITPEYYLHSFTDDELLKVLVEYNEWSEFDLLLSERILSKRGVKIDQEDLAQQRKLRDASFETPENGQNGWIVFGYTASFLGGFIGIILGYSLWKSKKKLPNGGKVPAYNDGIRMHGKNIFYIGVAVFVIIWIFRLGQMIG